MLDLLTKNFETVAKIFFQTDLIYLVGVGIAVFAFFFIKNLFELGD